MSGSFFRMRRGGVRAWFNEEVSIALPRLPAHDPVYAMTIHKSQGSEAENVMVILPDRDSPLLTGELLYTGVTRAKKEVVLLGSDEIIKGAISKKVSRISGIAFALK